jgi:hypothetical protein
VPGIYRYEPHSGTWQLVTDSDHEAQVPGIGGGASVDTAAFIGRKVLLLPGDPVPGQHARYGITVNAISDDAHVVAGTAVSSHEDVGVANQPIIWRCR